MTDRALLKKLTGMFQEVNSRHVAGLFGKLLQLKNAEGASVRSASYPRHGREQASGGNLVSWGTIVQEASLCPGVYRVHFPVK